MITNISITIKDDKTLNGGEMEGSILININQDDSDWIEISSSLNEKEIITFPRSILDDVVDALMLIRGDK